MRKIMILTAALLVFGTTLATAGCQDWIKVTMIGNLQFSNSADKSVNWVNIHFLNGFKGAGFNLAIPTPYHNLPIYSNGWSTGTYNSMIASLLTAQSIGHPIYLKLSHSVGNGYAVVDFGAGESAAGLECFDYSGGSL